MYLVAETTLYIVTLRNCSWRATPPSTAGAVALYAQAENTPDNSGSFFVNQPVVLVLRVFAVAEYSVAGGGFARPSTALPTASTTPMTAGPVEISSGPIGNG